MAPLNETWNAVTESRHCGLSPGFKAPALLLSSCVTLGSYSASEGPICEMGV